jgi:8-oxo-dGTP diphosphatase
MHSTAPTRIRIVAALVFDDQGRVLLVRKRGTRAFMQPGGKLNAGESRLVALNRELNEELCCSLDLASTVFLGLFSAPAANEPGCEVQAALYKARLLGEPRRAAEIDELLWLHPAMPQSVHLAPLTKYRILPLATHLLDHDVHRSGRPI